MKYLGPTRHPRLNEALAVVYLLAGLFVFISLASYNPFDASLNTVSGAARPLNLTGRVGAYLSDFFLQSFGFGAYAIPALFWLLGWKWLRSSAIDSAFAKAAGSMALLGATCAAFGLIPGWHPIAGLIPAGGLIGGVLASWLLASFNMTGAIIVTAGCWIVALYLVSTFEMARLAAWLGPVFRAPLKGLRGLSARLQDWREERARKARMRAQARIQRQKLEKEKAEAATPPAAEAPVPGRRAAAAAASASEEPPIVDPLEPRPPAPAAAQKVEDIPIHTLELPPWEPAPPSAPAPAPTLAERRSAREPARPQRAPFRLPSTELLQEPPGRSAYDSQELKDIAAKIKSKFEEFNVRGSVVQINPGPVVTTFEYKPEAGVKYSRITTLTEDLCLGLQAESVLIERLPGKPTVGIEVPNTKREVISFRAVLESPEFQESPSRMTIALGRDINGRIKVASLETMTHLLIAGATGAGKSVMLNAMIMSFLYKATPDEVRMIMIDPKRVELGIYEGIPHLLTPVITEPKKATNALRNAVIEMERRLKLLAAQGVRNVDQYNRKIAQLRQEP